MSSLRVAIEMVLSWLVSGLAFLLSGRRAEKHVLILASNGDENIGDVALLRAAIQNIDGRIVVLARDPGSYRIEDADRARVKVVSTQLVWGTLMERLSSMAAFGRYLRLSREFCVIGADNMDGGYGDHFAISEWKTAIVARLLGVPTRVFGFSWSDSATPDALRASKVALRLGSVAYLRDPESYRRFKAVIPGKVVLAADMVFLLRPTRGVFATPHSPFVILNVSALIASRVDLAADYRVIVRGILDRGYQILVLPHVGGMGNDDRVAARDAIGDSAQSTDVVFVDDLLEPEEISAVASKATFVITGRMHLSVLAMTSAVPSFVLATQGKVEGLMELAGVPENAIVPAPGFSSLVLDLIEKEDLASTSKAINGRLPHIQELARRNFDRLIALG